MKAIIVDDNEENIYLIESLLKANGYHTESAENGSKALEMIRNNHFDLIISDILMPVMDGFQLCRIVKTDKALCHIPFIVYTATYTGPQDEVFARKIGADCFIVKPCEPEIFIATVRDVMNAGKRIDIPETQQPREEEVLKLYSERLVRKLEQKMFQAETELHKRQAAEEELKESEQKLRLITTSVQDAIIMMNDQGKVSFWNKAAERIFGYSDPEIIGKDLHITLAPGKFHDHYHKNHLYFKETGQGPYLNKVAELAGKKKDGTEFPIELSLSGVEIHGKWHAIGIVRDITEKKRIETEQKKIEKKIQQTQRMEAIGTLAGGIAHDFNNILSAMLGYSQLALDTVEKDSLLHNDLKCIYDAGIRAKELVQQILTLARQSDDMVHPVQPGLIAKEALKLLRSTIPTTIDLRNNIVSESMIMGNSGKIHQVLMNLCTNAAYAMEKDGGLLEVGLKDVTIKDTAPMSNATLKPGDYVELTVSDTGIGIPADIIGSIFEPYFTTKAPGEGTGIGLALVHGIVTGYGGKITADSKMGKGTVFTVQLPITKKHTACQPGDSGTLPSGTEHILFVDDEEQIARIGSRILESLGYTVTTKTVSTEALSLFRSKPEDFDLVITDMTMPNMTGDIFSAELMKIRPDIPVILCTGYSKKMSNQAAKKMGIKAFAYKPVGMADLAKTVRRVLDETQKIRS